MYNQAKYGPVDVITGDYLAGTLINRALKVHVYMDVCMDPYTRIADFKIIFHLVL